MGTGWLTWKGLLAVTLLIPQQASEDRLYGRIETVRGEVHTGFIRWGRGGGSWADFLTGNKELPEENLRQVRRLRAEADPEADRAARSVVYNGIRISWDEDDTDFAPDTAQSGIRFGHVRRASPDGAGGVRLELKTGRETGISRTLSGRIEFVDTLTISGEGGELRLPWSEIASVEFLSAPAGSVASAVRLHGTVRARTFGPSLPRDSVARSTSYTGYLTIDAGRIYTSDALSGRVGSSQRSIPFGEIETLTWTSGSSAAQLALRTGETLELADARSGNRSVRIQDPGLGGVQLPLNRVMEIRFHAPERPAGYDRFDGGHRLRGTVVQRDGRSHSGFIRWDNDEEHGWEILNGSTPGMTFTVELGSVKEISVETPRRALVTLWDGRELDLAGSNDVGPGNKGIVIQKDDGSWRFVDWLQLDRVEFERP